MPAARRTHLSVVPSGDLITWTDRELVAALLARDPRAAVLTWRAHAPRIFRVVERTLGSSNDAEDVTQEIFLRVFARIDTLRDPDALGSFVLSVALRVIKGHLRYRRVRRILHVVETVPETAVPGLDIDSRRSLRRFYEALDTLPASERLVFALRHIEGMTLSEVANSSGVSMSTAKRLLRKSYSRLAKRVEADPVLTRYASRMISDVV
jgi:RNA polymerase sigma-70 factor (ECF subfamily)